MIDDDRPRTESVEQSSHDLHDIFIGADAQRDDVTRGSQVFAVVVAHVRDVAQRIERAKVASPHMQVVAHLGDGGSHR